MGNQTCKLQCRQNSFKTMSYQANSFETNEKITNQLQQATQQILILNTSVNLLKKNSTEHKATKQLSFQLQQLSRKNINRSKSKKKTKFKVQIENKLISSLNQKQQTSESLNISSNLQSQYFAKFNQKDQILTKSVKFNQKCSNRQLTRQISRSQIRKNSMKSLCPYNNHSHKKINFSVDLFIKPKKKKIQDEYVIENKIGEGSFGTVYKARSIINHSIVAVKIFKKKIIRKTLQAQKLNTQIQILRSLDHPNIVKIIDVYHNENYYYVVTQYYAGGTLKDFLQKKQRLKDYTLIKIIFKQILYGLAYLHSKQIIHRDIKFENIVFENNIDNLLTINDVQIKIIDFGLAKKQQFKGINKDIKQIGTPKFMAPEVLLGQYSQKSDVWSCGVMLHTLIKGSYPFQATSLRQLLQKISKDQISFETQFWRNQDKQLVILLKKMLQKNFLKRISSVNALKQNWLSRKTHKLIQSQKQIISKKLFSNRYQNNFIRLVQYYIVSRKSNTSKDKKNLVQLFQQIDLNNNGIIQAQELATFFPDFKDFNKQKHAIKSSIDNLLQNNSGKLQISQFMAVITDKKLIFTIQNLNDAFQFFDSNKNGFIQIKQLKRLMSNCDSEQFVQLMQDIDEDKDQKISKQQFFNYFKVVQGCNFD